MVEVKFTVELKSGDADIRTALTGNDGKEYPVCYMTIERLNL